MQLTVCRAPVMDGPLYNSCDTIHNFRVFSFSPLKSCQHWLFWYIRTATLNQLHSLSFHFHPHLVASSHPTQIDNPSISPSCSFVLFHSTILPHSLSLHQYLFRYNLPAACRVSPLTPNSVYYYYYNCSPMA